MKKLLLVLAFVSCQNSLAVQNTVDRVCPSEVRKLYLATCLLGCIECCNSVTVARTPVSAEKKEGSFVNRDHSAYTFPRKINVMS